MAMVCLGVGNPTGLLLLRCAPLAMVVWGTLQVVATVFNTADASMGLMATINGRRRLSQAPGEFAGPWHKGRMLPATAGDSFLQIVGHPPHSCGGHVL